MSSYKRNSPGVETHTDHKGLVKRAGRWLMRSYGCGFVLSELTTYAGETPDAIGWKHGRSVLIECKANRADFKADGKKLARLHPSMGMGCYRYYMCPPGLIKQDELPRKWGLLYCYDSKVVTVVKAESILDYNLQNEVHMFCSVVRRVHIRGDLSKIYEPRPV